MILIEIYSKADCHLCDVAKDVLKKVQTKIPFEMRERIMNERDELYETYKEQFPVVFINNEFAYRYRVPEHDLMQKLQELYKQQQ